MSAQCAAATQMQLKMRFQLQLMTTFFIIPGDIFSFTFDWKVPVD